MSIEPYFEQARYNRWMNERLYAVCADLSDAERKAARGAFFSSVHGTLNHLLVGDKVWLDRLQLIPPTITQLDAILFDEFAELRKARRVQDNDICVWAESLNEQSMAAPLSYTGIIEPVTYTVSMHSAASHFFNHQIHHRGQLTTLLNQLGLDYGATDLIAMPELTI